MARFHATAQGPVPFTPEEEAARDAEEAQAALDAERARIPQVVTIAQARKALIMGGVSIAQVDATINAIEDATERELAQTDWEYSATVRRDSPLVVTLGPLLDLSESQIDDLFVLADTL